MLKENYFGAVCFGHQTAKDALTQLKGMLEIKAVLNEVLSQRTSDTEEFNLHFAELIDFMGFMNSEIPKLIEQWKASRK